MCDVHSNTHGNSGVWQCVTFIAIPTVIVECVTVIAILTVIVECGSV